jgi:hypothetical protein
MLARATAHILKVADVSQVVVGGGLAASWDLIEPAFSPRLEADLIPFLRSRVAVSVSHAGDQAGMIGAALLAGPAAVLAITGGHGRPEETRPDMSLARRNSRLSATLKVVPQGQCPRMRGSHARGI